MSLTTMWFRSHPWVVALIGLVLEAAATIPFALLDAPETSAALALLIAAAVAFLVGPRWGALVAAAGWALFFVFVVDHAVRALVALPVWLAAAILTGLASDRLRRTERERRRDASELDAVRGDETQAIIGLDLEGNILTWDRGPNGSTAIPRPTSPTPTSRSSVRKRTPRMSRPPSNAWRKANASIAATSASADGTARSSLSRWL